MIHRIAVLGLVGAAFGAAMLAPILFHEPLDPEIRARALEERRAASAPTRADRAALRRAQLAGPRSPVFDRESEIAARRLAEGRPASAVEAAERALALNPISYEMRSLRLRALVAAGRLDEALLAAEDLLTDAPDDAPTWLIKADILARQGRASAAEAARAEALAID